MSKENSNEKILKDAQYRKGLSIAYFNAINAAIALVSSDEKMRWGEESMIANVRKYRDLFLEDHKNYYATVIANVGKNYDPEKTIQKIKEVKTYDELSTLWLSLSEDERRDIEVLKVAKQIGAKYKNEKV